ncbi:MAG: hypothetical protein ACON4L_00510 [Flavobacteriaceae bacterium]
MLLITDNMNTDLVNPWRGNLKNIQSRDGKEVVILLWTPRVNYTIWAWPVGCHHFN